MSDVARRSCRDTAAGIARSRRDPEAGTTPERGIPSDTSRMREGSGRRVAVARKARSGRCSGPAVSRMCSPREALQASCMGASRCRTRSRREIAPSRASGRRDPRWDLRSEPALAYSVFQPGVRNLVSTYSVFRSRWLQFEAGSTPPFLPDLKVTNRLRLTTSPVSFGWKYSEVPLRLTTAIPVRGRRTPFFRRALGFFFWCRFREGGVVVRRISPVRYRVRSVAGEDVWSVHRERGATSTNPFLRFRRTRPRRESDGVSASSMRSWDGRPRCRTCCRREITLSRASEGATGPEHKPAPPLPEKAECIGAVRPATDRFL